MITALQTISAEAAVELILHGKPLFDFQIQGTVDLHKLEGQLNTALIFENCLLENLISPSVEFKYPVRFSRCHFKKCNFDFAYFLYGLTIDNCVFESYLNFQAGGHNQHRFEFTIVRSTFNGFVNFFDCWFQGNVLVMDNDFKKGTNLLGNKSMPYRVSFDVSPIVENNKGLVDLDGEEE